jgi:hypothetical protein
LSQVESLPDIRCGKAAAVDTGSSTCAAATDLGVAVRTGIEDMVTLDPLPAPAAAAAAAEERFGAAKHQAAPEAVYSSTTTEVD